MFRSVLAAAGLAALANAGQAIQASKACVTNSGGYVLHWWYDDLNLDTESPDSGNYPIDQTRCMDMVGNIVGLETGNFVEVYVHAQAGVTKSADNPLIYDPTGPVVTFTCNGTTLNFHCKANGYDEDEDLVEFQ